MAVGSKTGWITEDIFTTWFEHFCNAVQPKNAAVITSSPFKNNLIEKMKKPRKGYLSKSQKTGKPKIAHNPSQQRYNGPTLAICHSEWLVKSGYLTLGHIWNETWSNVGSISLAQRLCTPHSYNHLTMYASIGPIHQSHLTGIWSHF